MRIQLKSLFDSYERVIKSNLYKLFLTTVLIRNFNGFFFPRANSICSDAYRICACTFGSTTFSELHSTFQFEKLLNDFKSNKIIVVIQRWLSAEFTFYGNKFYTYNHKQRWIRKYYHVIKGVLWIFNWKYILLTTVDVDILLILWECEYIVWSRAIQEHKHKHNNESVKTPALVIVVTIFIISKCHNIYGCLRTVNCIV